jgi:hypothetical protein
MAKEEMRISLGGDIILSSIKAVQAELLKTESTLSHVYFLLKPPINTEVNVLACRLNVPPNYLDGLTNPVQIVSSSSLVIISYLLPSPEVSIQHYQD